MTHDTPALPEKRRRLDRVTAACDLCKKRKVKCDGEQPCGYCRRKNRADTCQFSVTKPRAHLQARSLENTPRNPIDHRSTVSTPHGAQDRARSELPTRRSGSLDENTFGTLISPTVSRDDHNEDTAVPLEGRILRDAQGKFIFIGDCAPLSFLQTVRHLVSNDVESDGFPVPAARDSIIENAPPATSNQSQDTSIESQHIPRYVKSYFSATSGLVELFESDQLERDLGAWARGMTSHTDDAASAVFFLVLAIGAQDDRRSKSDAWFQHARDVLSKNMCSNMNVATVQGFTLVAIYMLLTFQPNGAYLYFSLAARTAYAIGIHRTEINATFGEPIRTMRDRIWKSLRIVDMLISTNLGRPPSTSDVDCTVKYSVSQMNTDFSTHILDASVQIFMIIERVVVEVYSRKRISLRIADFVSRQLKSWASNWLQPLTNMVAQPSHTDPKRIALVGACSTLCTYYYGIMLLTRPFLIYEIYEYTGASMRNIGSPSDHASKRRYADAALDAASSFVETLKAAVNTGALPRRSPLIVSWLFTTSLVLAVGTLGRSGSTFVETCKGAIDCLAYFGQVDPHAQQYAVIVQSLLDLMNKQVEKREKQLRLQRKQASSDLFGLLSSDTNSSSDRVYNSHFPPASASTASYSLETPLITNATPTAAQSDWTMYDADFFALPWPTEYDPGLQDFLQPGTHTSDGASVADIPLFPIYDQQMGRSFRS